jgi:hypothetical protein
VDSFPQPSLAVFNVYHIFDIWMLHFCQCSGEALFDFLEALNDSNGRITDWNIHFVSPCASWSHVTCIGDNVVSL